MSTRKKSLKLNFLPIAKYTTIPNCKFIIQFMTMRENIYLYANDSNSFVNYLQQELLKGNKYTYIHIFKSL